MVGDQGTTADGVDDDRGPYHFDAGDRVSIGAGSQCV